MNTPIPAGKVTALAMDEAALAYARRFQLVREDGTVRCIKDHCDGDATLPTLECQGCRDRRLDAAERGIRA